MIKNLRDLEGNELEVLQIFMGENGKKLKKSKIYSIFDINNRETFILFDRKEIKALVTLNLDEVLYKKIIYIKNILYKTNIDLQKLMDLLKEKGIISNSKLIFNLDGEKFSDMFGEYIESYSIVEMEIEIESFEKYKNICSNFTFEHLNIANKMKFKAIVNESFEMVPNSKTINEEEVQEYIEDINMENEYLFVKENKNDIGFVEIKVEKSIAEISLGFIKEERGKNKGTLLLCDVVNYLRKKDVKKVKLFCASNNYRAYNLYKKFGFSKVKVVSQWSY
ncbi:MAG: GNAT family N-acetyltransferase [Sarcina sp.]